MALTTVPVASFFGFPGGTITAVATYESTTNILQTVEVVNPTNTALRMDVINPTTGLPVTVHFAANADQTYNASALALKFLTTGAARLTIWPQGG